MSVHVFRGLIPLVIAGCVVVAQPAAGQNTPDSTLQHDLNRIGGDLFSATPHAADAIRELKAILAGAPSIAEAHMLLGIAYRVQGSPELMAEAVAELRQALALNPALALARLTLARVYLDMARASRARDELDVALGQMPGNPQLLSLLGEAERQLGNPRRSVELNREALQRDAGLVQARYYLGLALRDLRELAEAIGQLELVVQSGVNPAEANLALGTVYLDAGRSNEALAALREAARADASRPETHIQLSRVYRTKGRLADAEKELELARPSSTAGSAAIYRGVESEFYMEEGLLRMRLGRFEAAAESFQRVLAIDPAHALATQRLAEARKRLRQRAPKKGPGESS